jgi:glyoxylate reductase
MSKPNVFVTRQLDPATLEPLSEICNLEVWEDHLPPPYSLIAEKAKTLDGLLCLLTDNIDANLIDNAPNLKVISNMAVGYDNIDVTSATKQGIPVGNTPGVLTETSADFAFALLMAVARRIPEAQQYVKDGEWKTWHPTILSGQDIYGATLGIIGLGRIGQAVARRAKGFGMKIIYHGGSNEAVAKELGAEKVELDDLLKQSDFVSLNLPLNEKTHHFISTRELQFMKSTAILINTARGGVLDSQALYTALKNNDILAAGLDVTDPEPIPMDDPLLTLENCVIVPHIASASVATRTKMAQMAVNNVIAGITGETLPTCVNSSVYE